MELLVLYPIANSLSLIIQIRLIVIAITFQPALKEKLWSVIHPSSIQSFCKAVVTTAVN